MIHPRGILRLVNYLVQLRILAQNCAILLFFFLVGVVGQKAYAGGKGQKAVHSGPTLF